MSSFRTVLNLTPAHVKINHASKLLLIGSCFTEHIGQKLANQKFNTQTNPFGIVYNPISISECIHRLAAGNQEFEPESQFENAGLWHSWEHHGHFSHPDQKEALAHLNSVYRSAADHLKKTNFLILTLGTAEVFELRETQQIVANNHKMPAALFNSRRLSVAEIVESLGNALSNLKQSNPSIQVILSVSPVRHIRNGLVENQRSKATLLLACEALCDQLEHTHYFPAYELLMDDLRDYRFYTSDMLHPSELAVDYVWQFFSNTYFAEQTRQLNERIEKITTAAQHRPFHPDTPQHQAFVRAQLVAIEALKNEMSGLDFSAEQEWFLKTLQNPTKAEKPPIK